MAKRYLFLLLFLLITLSKCSPPTDRYGQLDDFDLQGHRGAMGMFAENTIPGFMIAIDQGVNTVEFDVVISADDEVVVSHEPWFRPSICLKPDGSEISEDEIDDHLIYQLTYDEISQYDCGSRQNPEFPDQQNRAQPKPTMAQAIIAMEGYISDQNLDKVNYSIEIKYQLEWENEKVPDPETFARLVYEELSELDILDRVIIQSFSPASLRAMRNLNEDIRQALLVSRNGGNVDEDINNLGYTPEIYSPHHMLVSSDLVREAQEQGMTVVPWTVNDPEDMRNMLEMNVDGLITDYPDRFNEYIRELLQE